MNEKCLLSIMVETYNQEDFISQTLDSIINQNYSFPYEIIVGDDCSTDKTPQILDDYAKKYPQIKVLHNIKNLGAMGNYYNVLSYVSGKYVMDCAGDDYWLPGKVETQIRFMESNPKVGMCYGKAKLWCEKSQKFKKNYFGIKEESFEELLQRNNIPALTVCLKKSLIDEYLSSVLPYEKKWLMEDYPMWLWFSKKSKISFIDSIFGVYRIMETSVNHSKDVHKELEFEKNVDSIKMYFARYFKVPLQIRTEDEIYYLIYKKKCTFLYNREDAYMCRTYLNKIGKKSIKDYIFYYSTYCKVLFIFFSFLNRLCHKK